MNPTDNSQKKYKWPINEEMPNVPGHKENANQNYTVI
jgi:hypothetical protein